MDLRIGADFRAGAPQYHAEDVAGPGAIKDEIHAALRWVDEGFGDYSEETRERFNQREEAIAPEQKIYIVVWDEERHVPIAVTRVLDPRGGQIFIEKDLLGGQNLERRTAYLELGVKLDALELGRTRIDSTYVGGVSALLKGISSFLTFRNPDLNFYNNRAERYQIWLFAENAAREPPYKDHPLSRHGFQFVDGPFSETPVDPEVLIFEINARNLMDRHFFNSRLLIPRKRLAGPSSAKRCAKLLLNDGASGKTASQSDP